MSETATKRIALTTLSAPAKKENKEKDKQHESSKAASGRQPELKTHRFVLTLPDSTEESCPEFNFADLLSSVSQPQKKKDNAPPHVNGSGPPPLDPFASDDEDQLRNIAKKFEEKYGGPVNKKKKSKKYDEYVDLGAGYDETDPFIDNTDAYDEIVPAELTTAHGGFYINSGALEFKPVEEGEEGQSDSGESGETESSSNESESDESDSEPNATKRRRVIESDDEDSKDESIRNGKETPSAAVNGSGDADVKKQTKKRIRLEDMVLKPSKKPSPDPQEAPSAAAPPTSAAASAAFAASKKIRPTVKELLQQKREKEKDAMEVKESAPAANKSGSDSGSDSSDSSSDSSESDSESGSEGDADEDADGEGKDSAKGDLPEENKTLPNNLPPTLTAAIEDIKKAAQASAEQGKCRFFSSEVNRFLLSIELLSRQLSCSKRQAVFSYLATFLPCTKHTLLKRAKNLVLESVEAQLKGAMKKLQAAIEKVIPEQIERHANECLQLAEANPERYIEYYRYAWDPELEPAGATDGEEDKPETKAKNVPPRRRFQWNKDLRLLLSQVVYLKAECFHWSKLRKESAEEYLTRFLDTEVKCLWPKGWMSTKILFKESKEAHTFVTSKVAPKMSSSKKTGSSLLVGLMDTLALPQTSQPHTASSSSAPAISAPVTSTAASSTATTASVLPVSTPTPPTAKESKKSHVPREKISPVSTPSRVDMLNLSKAEGTTSKKPESSSNSSSNNNGSVVSKPETGHNRTDPVPMMNRSESSNSSKSRTEAAIMAYVRSEKSNQPQVLDSLSMASSHSHQPSKSESGSNRHRPESSNHTSSSRPISENVSKTEHASSDASRNRNDAPHVPKSSAGPTIHVRPDLCVARPDRSDSGSKRSDPNPKADLVKGRSEGHHSTPLTHKTSDSLSDSMKSSRFESPAHFSRVDSMHIQSTSKSSDSGLQVKAEVASNSKNDAKPYKTKMPPNPSMASFVDSGFQWKDQLVHPSPDGEDKSARPPTNSSEQSRSQSDNVKSTESSGRQQHDEPEDQELMLQRELTMVMEELSRQADVWDDVPPKSDTRTKSVIKSTGSVIPAVPSVSASQPPPPPKMPSPTVSVLSKATPVSRSSPLPAAVPSISPSAANKLTPPNNNQSGSSRLVSPQSLNHPLSLSVSNLSNDMSNSGNNLTKYGGMGVPKVPSSEYLTPPTAHSSSSCSSSSNRQHLGPYFGPQDIPQHTVSSITMLSPEKRKSESSAPLPAHQQHSSTTSIARNASIFRNYPSSSAQTATTSPVASSVSPVTSRTPSTYHSIESLMQNRNVSDNFSPSSHRSSMVNISQQQQQHQQQLQQQLQQHQLPKIDPLALFMPQKNSTQRGSGHHQHSS